MDLKNYFNTQNGTGILSTADSSGRVDAAIYARPHVLDDGTLAMIMRERLSHKNLLENPYAVYLFMEQSHGYQGVRLFLKKVREDDDPELISKMVRRCLSPEDDLAKGPKFIVYFEIEKALKLVGSDPA
ncbi:pyridoxamine 5'-phosphate oxidase family protein [uncultured Desulfuromusa sp.]|uniref:pyridoxamine 5'-phosphate oxidase family protein n=1 Tax=uncultured Desulfuromusa sp. TaxID=219183 RepID=UPI002AA7E3B4|nr:pyridoxamine 5'-phosphate oxidase family protein [uncultured Desulfuromusa sp.]